LRARGLKSPARLANFAHQIIDIAVTKEKQERERERGGGERKKHAPSKLRARKLGSLGEMAAELSGFAGAISELLSGINAVTNPLSTFVDRITFITRRYE